MNRTQIDELAKKNADLPDGLLLEQQMLFLSLRSLYNQYKLKLISLKTAKREKQKVIEAYNQSVQKINEQDMIRKLQKKLLTKVKYNGTDYILKGITIYKDTNQAILLDINQSNSIIVAKVTDID